MIADTAPPVRYELFVHQGRGFVARPGNSGVTPDSDKLYYPVDGKWGWRPYDDITTVTLQTNYLPRLGVVAQCTIDFGNGRIVRIMNGNEKGQPDPERAETYTGFIDDFHARLITHGRAGRIDFRSGFSRARFGILVTALVAAGLMFIVLPLVLVIITGEVRLLLSMIVGGTLFWPAYKVAQRNAPGTYDPAYPPHPAD